ncbi:MAG: transposase [Synergistaceae bacterium]|nr:transposase [Synergistaceae bacterium]
MLKTLRVMLILNDKQRTRLFQFAGTARFAYNWALEQEKKNYDAGGKFLSDCGLRRRFTEFKNEPGNQWLYTISNNVCKQAVKVTGMHVKLENIAWSKKKTRQSANWFRLAEHERIPVNAKYFMPHVSYDGFNWFLTVGIECEASHPITSGNDGIGIDLGVKDLAVCSSGHVYSNINKTSRVRRLKKKQRRLQRKVSRKYEKNKEGGRYQKTRNIVKSEKQLLRVTHRLADIRTNYIQPADTRRTVSSCQTGYITVSTAGL